MKKTALVCGGGGFIGSHLVKHLKMEGYLVIASDLKGPDFEETRADKFFIGDLRDRNFCSSLFDEPIDEVYQLAADMGGAGYIFSGDNDANVMHNSGIINLHFAELGKEKKYKKIFYSSSACVYPEHNQMDPDNPNCAEDSAYPAKPDSEYGWEKLFSERVYLAFHKNYGVDVRIARFHNIFGPQGTWTGGKEKAPAAMCRKIAEVPDGGTIEIWGDGNQTRSFLYVDECVDGILRLMRQGRFLGPVNIGSQEMVSINKLAEMIMDIAGKRLTINHIDGALGVRGRNSDNTLIQKELGWAPSQPLEVGLKKTYEWIADQVAAAVLK